MIWMQRYRAMIWRAGARSCGDAREMLEPWTRGLVRILIARRAKEAQLPLLPLLLLHRNLPPRMWPRRAPMTRQSPSLNSYADGRDETGGNCAKSRHALHLWHPQLHRLQRDRMR